MLSNTTQGSPKQRVAKETTRFTSIPIRRMAQPNAALGSPAGLTGTIPTNGPVYIMRGAVYLNESYENKSGFSTTTKTTVVDSGAEMGHDERREAGEEEHSSSRMTPSKAFQKKGVSFSNLDDGSEATRQSPPTSSSSKQLPPMQMKKGEQQRQHSSKPSTSNSSNSGSFFNAAHAVVAGRQPLLLRPLMAHETPATEAIARQAERFIEAELKLLNASAERDPVGYRSATAQSYCQGVRMMLPQLDSLLAASAGGGAPSQSGVSSASHGGGPPSASNKITMLIERCFREFEQALVAAAHAASQPTRSSEERQKLEHELRLMYMQASEDRERELDKRQEELDNFSTNTAHRVLQLENQLNAAKQEISRLKAAQNEESDRFSSMAQSVLESRLAAQKAEVAMQEMKDRYDRVKVTEMVYMDLLKDHQDMNLMLREKRITFKTRIHFSVDDLLGEPTAAVLAQHAVTIRARQQEEIANVYKK